MCDSSQRLGVSMRQIPGQQAGVGLAVVYQLAVCPRGDLIPHKQPENWFPIASTRNKTVDVPNYLVPSRIIGRTQREIRLEFGFNVNEKLNVVEYDVDLVSDGPSTGSAKLARDAHLLAAAGMGPLWRDQMGPQRQGSMAADGDTSGR